jgi:hypothetical protein
LTQTIRHAVRTPASGSDTEHSIEKATKCTKRIAQPCRAESNGQTPDCLPDRRRLRPGVGRNHYGLGGFAAGFTGSKFCHARDCPPKFCDASDRATRAAAAVQNPIARDCGVDWRASPRTHQPPELQDPSTGGRGRGLGDLPVYSARLSNSSMQITIAVEPETMRALVFLAGVVATALRGPAGASRHTIIKFPDLTLTPADDRRS